MTPDGKKRARSVSIYLLADSLKPVCVLVIPVLVPVRASPVPSVVRGSFVVRFYDVKFYDFGRSVSAGRSRSSASERCSGPALASLALFNPITITQSHADPKGPCAAQAARACEWHSLCTYVLDHLRPSHAVAAAVSRPIWGQTPLVAASPAPPVNVTRP